VEAVGAFLPEMAAKCQKLLLVSAFPEIFGLLVALSEMGGGRLGVARRGGPDGLASVESARRIAIEPLKVDSGQLVSFLTGAAA